MRESLKVAVGNPFSPGEVIRKGVDLIQKYPVLMVPQLLILAGTILTDLTTGRPFAGARILFDIVSLVFEVIVAGTYPPMVQAAVKGEKVSVGDAFSKSLHRFVTLLLALLVILILVVVGLIALLVPGIIFVCWYAYSIPSIMLENKGVLDGMAASKAFGRDKKTSTFSVVIVIVLAGLVIELIQAVAGVLSPFSGHLVAALLEIPLTAWASTVFSYVYISSGPSSTGAPQSFPGQTQPTSVAPAPSLPEQAVAGTGKHFCPSCGAPIAENAKFCPSCGRPV